MYRVYGKSGLVALLLVLSLTFAASCQAEVLATVQPLPDGVYHGFYSDNGMVEIGLEFTITDGVFTSIEYLQLRYRDGNYLADTATESQRAIVGQFTQLTDSLIGHGEEQISELYAPARIAEDADAVSAATLKSGKLVYALRDGLLRGDISQDSGEDDLYRGFYTLDDTGTIFEDGTYRGFYYQDGAEWIAVQFNLTDGAYSSVSFRRLAWRDGDYLSDSATAEQKAAATVFRRAADALVGQGIENTKALCVEAAATLDGVSSATARTELMALAIINGLVHGPLQQAADTVLPASEVYVDGSYTATYSEHDAVLFRVHFTLSEGRFTTFDIRDTAAGWDDSVLGPFLDDLTGQEVSALCTLPSRMGGEKAAYAFCAAMWEALSQ